MLQQVDSKYVVQMLRSSNSMNTNCTIPCEDRNVAHGKRKASINVEIGSRQTQTRGGTTCGGRIATATIRSQIYATHTNNCCNIGGRVTTVGKQDQDRQRRFVFLHIAKPAGSVQIPESLHVEIWW